MNAKLESDFGHFIDSYTDDPDLKQALRDEVTKRPPKVPRELSEIVYDVLNSKYKNGINAVTRGFTQRFTSR